MSESEGIYFFVFEAWIWLDSSDQSMSRRQQAVWKVLETQSKKEQAFGINALVSETSR